MIKLKQIKLDREVAKISGVSSGNFDKYEYLTGEELVPKSGSIEKSRFKYSPIVQIFTKGFEEKDEYKEYGILPNFRNMEDKNEEQLKTRR